TSEEEPQVATENVKGEKTEKRGFFSKLPTRRKSGEKKDKKGKKDQEPVTDEVVVKPAEDTAVDEAAIAAATLAAASEAPPPGSELEPADQVYIQSSRHLYDNILVTIGFLRNHSLIL
ncbi:unnamed protein product, partial [Owenia fusiformis]